MPGATLTTTRKSERKYKNLLTKIQTSQMAPRSAA